MSGGLENKLVNQLGFKNVTEVLVHGSMHYFRGLDPDFDDDVEIKVNKQDGTVYSRISSPEGIDINVYVEGQTAEYWPVGQLSL